MGDDREMPDLETLNTTELLDILRRQQGVVVRRGVTRERLVQLVEEGSRPLPHELSGTTETRRVLQIFLNNNWSQINSQLPCVGTNRGKCTIYPCPEGRHLSCYAANRENIRVHMKLPDAS